MKLYKGIKTVVDQFGPEKLRTDVLVNFLSDYRAFEIPSTRVIMKSLYKYGYGEKIFALIYMEEGERNMSIDDLVFQIVKYQGFQETNVRYVFDCIAFGLGWTELPPLEIETAQKSEIQNSLLIEVNGVEFNMLYVKGGTFNMGATPEQGVFAAFDEKPSLETTVGDFYIAETQVTQALWNAVMLDNPSHFKGMDLPVERVSWDECQLFINELNRITGKSFRLAYESEWEYAARGGIYSCQYKYSGTNDPEIRNFVWCKENSEGCSHNVKSLHPNELGLYGMSGNISEWCQDWYHNSYANSTSRVNPVGPSFGTTKVYRGGSWDDKAMNCRVSKRYSMAPGFRNKLVGLRLVASFL